MLTHLIKSINWLDIALAFFLLRVIYIGVKNGFITEFFKALGVVIAVFVSLHYYAVFAAWLAKKTAFSGGFWQIVILGLLWLAVSVVFKFIRDGVLALFKIETTHEGFDKYAAGILAVGRGILLCSLMIFMVLLVNNGPVTRMTLHSYSYKIAGRAAVGTYSVLFNNLVDKLWAGQHYNTAAALVLHPESRK
ncbi:MAG: CvpA family protein [Candidatus Omnitrophica bacterium]|nr:CvpA family protein [Candidatus Omnitrophota bacterium]